jgi:polyhydroxyalkanoate synthesis regulator phasin
MGSFTGSFGGSSDIERRLEEMYVPMFVAGRGMSQDEARNMVRYLIRQAKEDAEKEGTTKIPPNFGNMLIDSEDKYQEIKTMLAKRRKEGVRDEDIRWWWNMHDLERRLMANDDEVTRLASFIYHKQEGKNSEQATTLVKKHLPIFGDPDDTRTFFGDDRPLPYELKDRVSIYIQHRANDDSDDYKRDVEHSSSFNALVRREIGRERL